MKNNRTKRRNKDFEKIYLRYTLTNNQLKHVDNALLNSVDTIKIIKSNVYPFYNFNRNALSIFGFDQSDIYNISLYYAALFISIHSKQLKRNKKYYSYMYNFINQNLTLFLQLCYRRNVFSLQHVDYDVNLNNCSYSTEYYEKSDEVESDTEINVEYVYEITPNQNIK